MNAGDAAQSPPRQLSESSPPQWPRGSLGRRTVAYVSTLLVLVVINFVLPRAVPGDPVEAMVARAAAGGGTQATIPDEQARAALEASYGLDEPLPAQFASYLSGLATGDLGVSIEDRRAVTTRLAERVPWSLLLMGTAMAMALAAGMLLGIHSGWRSGRGRDWLLLGAITTVRQIPPFFLAPLALLLFAGTLGWLPHSGASTPFAGDLGVWGRVADVGRHLVLPAGVLALQLTAAVYLFMRGSMVGELGAGYLRLGRAKGVPDRRLKYRHAARNALLPVVSLTAMQVAFLSTGTIFIETVFEYPGVGRLLFEGVRAHDYPLVQGGFLLLASLVVTANYVADVVYTRLDPRVSQ